MTYAVHVLACGMACPLGLRVGPALAAMYAGISRFEESPLVIDAAGDSARVAALAALPPTTSRTSRALFFATRALAEATAPIAGPTALPCFLALPGDDGDAALELPQVRRALQASTGAVALDWTAQRQFFGGRAGVFLALRAALEALDRGVCSLALIGSLDSRVDPISLQSLADGDRLLGRRNPDGLIPGEGAAFVLLAHPRAKYMSTAVLAARCALATEPHPRGSEGPHVGAGLTAVFADLRGDRLSRVDAMFSAQTGEARHARALAYACLRNHTLVPEPLRPVTLGALLGDTGAAAGAIATVAGLYSLRPPGQFGVGPRHASVLAYGESDRGVVGGCIFEHTVRGR